MLDQHFGILWRDKDAVQQHHSCWDLQEQQQQQRTIITHCFSARLTDLAACKHGCGIWHNTADVWWECSCVLRLRILLLLIVKISFTGPLRARPEEEPQQLQLSPQSM